MCRGCGKVVKSGWQVVRPWMMGTWLPETCWATIRREIKNTKSDIYLVFLIHAVCLLRIKNRCLKTSKMYSNFTMLGLILTFFFHLRLVFQVVFSLDEISFSSWFYTILLEVTWSIILLQDLCYFLVSPSWKLRDVVDMFTKISSCNRCINVILTEKAVVSTHQRSVTLMSCIDPVA